MTSATPPLPRAFETAPELRRSPVVELSLVEGVKRLFRRDHLAMASVWLLAVALGLGAIGYGVRVFTAPAEVVASLPLGPSWKLGVAIAIYCGVMAYGSKFLLRGVARLDREVELIAQAEHCADRSRTSDEARTEDFLKRSAPFVFHGEGAVRDHERTAVFELDEILRKNALERRFDPVGVAVERIAEKVLGGSFGIRDAQQLGVRLGILWTFIGIVLSLSGVGTIMGPSTLGDAEIRAAIRNIVAALGLAFVSSIAGLLASILLQVLGSWLRAKELALIEQLQKLATSIQGIYARAVAKTDEENLAAEIAKHSADISSLNTGIADGARRLETALRDAGSLVQQPILALDRQAAMVTGAIAAQEKAFAAITELGDRVVAVQRTFVAAQEEGDRSVARSVDALALRLIAEVRSGFGDEARREIEERIERSSERTERAMRALTRSFTLGMVIAGLALGTTIAVAILVGAGVLVMPGP